MSSRIASMHPHERKSTQSTVHDSHNDRESFGARLRRERERRKISIASIADSTKILGALLEGLEREDVSRWPVGFYRRAFLRAYANEVGLDPDETWREFAERFPEPGETVCTPRRDPGSAAGLRLTLAERVTWFVGGPLLRRLSPRVAAVAFDVAIVGSVGICSFAVFGHFWLPFSIAAVCYYGGGVLVLGNGPGVCLFAPLAEELMLSKRSEIAETRQPPPQPKPMVKKVTRLKPLDFRPASHR